MAEVGSKRPREDDIEWLPLSSKRGVVTLLSRTDALAAYEGCVATKLKLHLENEAKARSAGATHVFHFGLEGDARVLGFQKMVPVGSVNQTPRFVLVYGQFGQKIYPRHMTFTVDEVSSNGGGYFIYEIPAETPVSTFQVVPVCNPNTMCGRDIRDADPKVPLAALYFPGIHKPVPGSCTPTVPEKVDASTWCSFHQYTGSVSPFTQRLGSPATPSLRTPEEGQRLSLAVVVVNFYVAGPVNPAQFTRRDVLTLLSEHVATRRMEETVSAVCTVLQNLRDNHKDARPAHSLMGSAKTSDIYGSHKQTGTFRHFFSQKHPTGKHEKVVIHITYQLLPAWANCIVSGENETYTLTQSTQQGVGKPREIKVIPLNDGMLALQGKLTGLGPSTVYSFPPPSQFVNLIYTGSYNGDVHPPACCPVDLANPDKAMNENDPVFSELSDALIAGERAAQGYYNDMGSLDYANKQVLKAQKVVIQTLSQGGHAVTTRIGGGIPRLGTHGIVPSAAFILTRSPVPKALPLPLREILASRTCSVLQPM